jgi:hypothetical protein
MDNIMNDETGILKLSCHILRRYPGIRLTGLRKTTKMSVKIPRPRTEFQRAGSRMWVRHITAVPFRKKSV